MIKYSCKGGNVLTLGEKLKKIRLSNNLKQSELADMLFVSEKTISSWENNRTAPDLNMIYKISDHFQKSFYCLISDDYNNESIDEIEIKLKVDNQEYLRILNQIKNNSILKREVKQIDTYYTTKDFYYEWLRIRNECGKYILNYKKKIDDSHYEKYDVLIDNIKNLEIILKALKVEKIGTLKKDRTTYLYKENYEFSFDNIENIGTFIEIEVINKTQDLKKDLTKLLKVLEELKIDLNNIERKKYIDYL